MSAIRVVGIDLSLTSTGIARLAIDADGTPHTYTTTVGRPGSEGETLDQRFMRLARLAADVTDEVPVDTDLVLIEGPAYAAQFGHPHDRSGAWWLVVAGLSSRLIRPVVVEVVPQLVKMWATGRGNAAKPAVTQRVIEHWGQHFTLPAGPGRSDVADAISLVTLGAAHLGHHFATLGPDHLRALDRMTWPAVP